MESLFTKVPVSQTVDIIIQRAYSHPTLPPPSLQPEDLRDLLKICTQQTPFLFNSQFYVQCDGVSMGSPLGPTFADFYMSDLENRLLLQDRISNPIKYFRYVDDILAIFKSESHIRYFKQRLMNHSVLIFTVENMASEKFHFLDINMEKRADGRLDTSVYIKPTDCGLYVNFNSLIPEHYKFSVVKTLVNRAIKYSSTHITLISELNRIKQIMVNNDFPLYKIDQIIKNKLEYHAANADNNNSVANPALVKFFVQFFDVKSFKSDSRKLRNIVASHIKPTNGQAAVSVVPYYRPYQVAGAFSTRPKVPSIERNNVVYVFECSEQHCSACYTGHTTRSLGARIKQHRYAASSIYQHYARDHSMLPPNFDVLKNHFEIFYSNYSTISLKIAEAIKIKSELPFINVKYNELYDFLKLF